RRHKIENFFQRIKELRAIATRYEKLASRFLALVLLASICDWFAR
ncbi:MAG: IS5/IS1182 family transposase, partial [Verrucomicrobia bacterium]